MAYSASNRIGAIFDIAAYLDFDKELQAKWQKKPFLIALDKNGDMCLRRVTGADLMMEVGDE